MEGFLPYKFEGLIFRGLYMEGLLFGILQYLVVIPLIYFC